MAATIRKKDGENLTDSAIEDVISKLDAEKPITKVVACSLLRISYNPNRLNTILQQFKDDKEYRIKRKKELRNTPVPEVDKKYIISSYLTGTALQEIADAVFRSTGIVKRILTEYNVPLRVPGMTYLNPIDLHVEEEPKNDYKVGDLTYSSRYDTTAEIRKVMGKGIYRIWLFNGNQYAYQPFYELSDLRRLQIELGIKLEYMTSDECIQEVQLGLRNAKKKKAYNE